MVPEITAEELKKLQTTGEDFQLIDVREEEEFEMYNLKGKLIPLKDIPDNLDKISKTKKVIIHCHSGTRSAKITEWLMTHHGFDNIYSLKGGILNWIDPSTTSEGIG